MVFKGIRVQGLKGILVQSLVVLGISSASLSAMANPRTSAQLGRTAARIGSVTPTAWGAAAQNGVETVLLEPDYVFIPPGFDDNDQTEVVIYGYLPNTCYRVGPAKAEYDAARGRVVIRNEAYFSDSSWCLQMTLPYTQTLTIGILNAGQYGVTVTSSEGKQKAVGTLKIAQSSRPSAGPDDSIYGLVEDIKVEGARSGNPTRRMTVRGLLSSSCLELQEVRVLNRVPNLVEVLPIARFKSESQCEPGLVPFETTLEFQTQSTGPTLFHVRSLNGQALNRVVELH